MDRECHRHVIWGWRDGAWQLRSSTDVCNGNPGDEYSAYQLNISWCEHGQVHAPTGELPHHTWPGYIDSPDAVYFVAVYGWSPGMPDWQEELSTLAYPQGVALSSETLQQIGLPPAPTGTPQETAANWPAALSIGAVAGAALFGLAALMGAKAWACVVAGSVAAVGGGVLGGMVKE